MIDRVAEAEDALTLWGAAVIRVRRATLYGALFAVAAGGSFGVSYKTPDASTWAAPIGVFAAAMTFFILRIVFVLVPRKRDAHQAFIARLRELDYGDDVARAAARQLLQRASLFDR